jgi:hypothetical protein
MIPIVGPVTRWWWVAYTNARLPKGQQALGCVIIKHGGPEHLVAAELIRLGLAPPSGTPHFGVIALEWGDPPRQAETVCVLLDKDQAERLAKEWDPGHRGLAGPDDIKRAFLDDDAKDGDPLFKRKDGQ